MTRNLQFALYDSPARRVLVRSSIVCVLLISIAAFAQDRAAVAGSKVTDATAIRQQEGSGVTAAPEANPGRPTVSTPATLTPVGYLQFETGILAAWHSPEFSAQTSIGEVTKFSVHRRIELLAAANPFAHTDTEPRNGAGDTLLGVQGVAYQGDGVWPTIALSYFGRVYSGDTPDLDIGSANNSALLLVSADVGSFHFDTNYLCNEAVSDRLRRAQFGQTLSISHRLGGRFGLSGEVWHFTQPFLRGDAVGNLWALNYNAKKNLVFDAAFNRGLTSTSTRWEFLAGFTYLLPRRIRLR